MRLAVVAANGRSGRAFVQAALAAGHTIRAGIRGTADFPTHPNLVVVECDATKESDLVNLFSGQEAVVSFIGHVKDSPRRVQTEAMRVIVKTMQAAGIKRVVSLTGTGVRFPGDRIPLYDRFLNVGISIVDPDRVRDGIEHAEVLKNSDLEWTIVRVLKLQDTRPTRFILNAHGKTKLFVSRVEVAVAVLEVLERQSFIGEAPILSKVS